MNLFKKVKNLDKYTKLAIIVIIIAVLIRFSLVSIYHVSGDACWQLSNAKFIAENGRIPLFEQFGRDELFWAPPFFHIISSFVYGTFIILSKDIANFAIKLISPILGSLTLIFLFLISKKLFNKKIAFFALIFLAFIPLHIDYSVFSYIDGTVTFLAVLSVYLALKNQIIWSGLVAGLTILTKYNGIFILPVIIYIIYRNNKDKKNLVKNLLIFLIIAGAIGSIWFIRNWIFLGNPVYPFMQSIFHGIEIGTFAQSQVGSVNLLNILSVNGIITFYLGIFGVPNGNISTLSFFQVPYFNFLFSIWIISTIIFIIPLIIGIASKKLNHKRLLSLWIGSYIILIFLYVINSSWSVARFMLPAFPVIALIWANGLEKIRFKNIKRILIILIVLIAIGFMFTSFVKISLAANAWNFYANDFEWVISNTGKDELFMTGSQCISYNIERQTVSPEISNLERADYIWVNQDFKLDRRAILSKDIIQQLNQKNSELIYENKETGTKVYKIN